MAHPGSGLDPLGGRTVVAAVRAVTDIELLHDVLTLLASDPRLVFRFAVAPDVPGEVFRALERAVTDLCDLPVRPWEHALADPPALVVTADEAIRDLLPEQVATVTLTPDQGPRPRVRVHTTVPGAGAKGGVEDLVTDPRWERMLAAAGRRHRYRNVLGTGERRLVVVSGRPDRRGFLIQHRAMQDLLGFLPVDDYQVAYAAHPSLWWEPQDRPPGSLGYLRLIMGDLVEAGVALVPPQGYRAAILAADVFLGEANPFAAALGTPVLPIAPAHPAQWHDTSPARWEWDLVDAIAAARPVSPLAPQAQESDAARRLRPLLYRALGLTPAEEEAFFRPLPDLTADRHDPTAWRVRVSDLFSEQPLVERYTAGVPPKQEILPLVVDADDTQMTRWESAKAWSHRHPLRLPEAKAWAASRFTRYPMTRVVACATDTGVLVVYKDGTEALLPPEDAAVTVALAVAKAP